MLLEKGAFHFLFFPTRVIKARQFSHWFDKLFFVDEFRCHYICPTSETLPIVLKQSIASKMDFFISDASWRIHEKTLCVRIAEIITNHIWSASWHVASPPVWVSEVRTQTLISGVSCLSLTSGPQRSLGSPINSVHKGIATPPQLDVVSFYQSKKIMKKKWFSLEKIERKGSLP